MLSMAKTDEEKMPLLKMDSHSESDNLVSLNHTTLQLKPSIVHCHVPEDEFDYAARNRLIAVLVLCFTFMIVEIIGGVISNSTAIVTDAAHMCTDAISFLISLIAMYVGRKRPTKHFSYGYIRAEILGALLSILAIWLITGILIYAAIHRCIDQSFVVKPNEMIAVAACGVVFNIIMFVVLHMNLCGSSLSHHSHSHDGNHSHSNHCSSTLNKTESKLNEKHAVAIRTSKNINVRAAAIHVIGDFFQSIGVLLAAILIKLKPEYKLADPICTFVFSVLVIVTTVTIVRDIVVVLMEGAPTNVDHKKILEDLLGLPGVRHVHSLHVWSLSMQKPALSVHIAIEREYDYESVLNQAQVVIRGKYSVTLTTIQIEPYDQESISACEICRQLNS